MTTLAFIMFDGAGGALGGWAAGRLYQVHQKLFSAKVFSFCLGHKCQNLLLGQMNNEHVC